MTLGELKLECLKVMFDIEYDITPEEMTANDEYATRLTNIMGSINRALARIDAVNKLAIKPNVTHEYEPDIEMWLLKRLPNNLSDDTDLKEEYGLSNYILEIVPYFVKADLYEEDDKNMAIKAFSVFEGFLNDLPTPPKNDQIRKSKPDTEEVPPIINKHYNIYKWDD